MGTIVVIATYNEAETIGQIIKAAPYPVIVVDDSSPDGTGEIARATGATVISRPVRSGIASAYYDGFKAALEHKPDYVIQMDAGLTHNPNDIKSMMVVARNGNYDLVIGSRFLNSRVPGYRALISRAAAFLMRFHGLNVYDATSGFRCWKAELLEQVIAQPFRSTNFAFQLEALYRARHSKIAEMWIKYKLTNSSFKPSMLMEALKIWATLAFTD